MSKPLEYRYDLSKRKCSIQSFAIRETTGKDEDVAALITKAKGGAASMLEEIVRLSITKVDDAPVNTDGVPLGAYDEWSSRTRTFILNAYKALNGINQAEGEDFLASGTLSPPG